MPATLPDFSVVPESHRAAVQDAVNQWHVTARDGVMLRLFHEVGPVGMEWRVAAENMYGTRLGTITVPEDAPTAPILAIRLDRAELTTYSPHVDVFVARPMRQTVCSVPPGDFIMANCMMDVLAQAPAGATDVRVHRSDSGGYTRWFTGLIGECRWHMIRRGTVALEFLTALDRNGFDDHTIKARIYVASDTNNTVDWNRALRFAFDDYLDVGPSMTALTTLRAATVAMARKFGDCRDVYVGECDGATLKMAWCSLSGSWQGAVASSNDGTTLLRHSGIGRRLAISDITHPHLWLSADDPDGVAVTLHDRSGLTQALSVLESLEGASDEYDYPYMRIAMERHHSACNSCDDLIGPDDSHTLRGHDVCTSCWRSETIECEQCHIRTPDYFHANNPRGHRMTLCGACYRVCAICSTAQSTMVNHIMLRHAEAFGDHPLCDQCGLTNPDGTDLNRASYTVQLAGSAEMEKWNYKPLPMFLHRHLSLASRVPSAKQLYIGVETEIEYNVADPDQLRREMAAPFWYFKHDGSLSNGMEIVTQPFTYDWLLAHHGEITKRLDLAKTLGARSHDTTTCGLHVHLSRECFSKLSLLKFMTLIYDSPNFAVKMAGRSVADMERYASIRPYGHEAKGRQKMIRDVVKRGNTHKRYLAVNLGNKGTVEVRMFRGTLLPESWLARVEFCVAAFAFARTTSVRESSPVDFRVWCRDESAQFPHLYKFLTEEATV